MMDTRADSEGVSQQPSSAKPESRAVTLATVARAAGVSLPTVSKVINGRPDVAPGTERRSSACSPSMATSGGRSGAATEGLMLDLVFDSLSSAYSLEIIRGVTAAATQVGVDTVVGLTPDDPHGVQWVHRLAESGRAGVIVVTSAITAEQVDQFRRSGLPLVVIDPVDVPEGVPSIGATNWHGGLSATEHARTWAPPRGDHRWPPERSVLASAPARVPRGARGREGRNDPELVRHGDFGFELAFERALSLLDLPDRPTGIFAASDFQAFGVVEAARVRGLRVPEDISVVGFDDLSISRWAAPPLTTVHQPLVKMGRVACQTLLAMAAGERPESQRVELSTHLVVRESTAPPV